MKHYTWLIRLTLASLLLLGGLEPSSPSAQAAPPELTKAAVPAAPTAALLASFEGVLEQIYSDVNPSVVNIHIVEKAGAPSGVVPDSSGTPLIGPGSPQGNQSPQYRYATASGFVWDKAGDIVTNNHVVEGADKITVTFNDGTTVLAKVVGRDPESDLAVVRIDLSADRLQPVRLADSTQARVGQLTVAIGNPFGLEGTMTVGFISALGRLLPVDSGGSQSSTYSIADVIQTDTPINPGNSGGVLVDDQGRVLAVVSAFIGPGGSSAGIGFAIPSAIVQKVVPLLIKTGHYEHPWLGVSGTGLSPDITKAMALKDDQLGGLLVDVAPGSPASRAGLRGSDRQIEVDGEKLQVGGDVIVGIDGTPITKFNDVVTYVARHVEVGQTLKLTVLRRGKEQTVQLTATARPTVQAKAVPSQADTAAAAWLGLNGVTIISEVAQAMNLPFDQQGVLVERVTKGSPAEAAGLKPSNKPVSISGRRFLVGGDVITAVDNQDIATLDDLQSFLQQAQPGDQVTLTVLRSGKELQVDMTLGAQP
jgi:serine protease Do